MGLVIWGMMIALVFKRISKYFQRNIEFKRMISLLLIAYFAYTFYTGDYGTFRVMMIFYSLIVANEMCYQNANQKKVIIAQSSVNTDVIINNTTNKNGIHEHE